MNQIQKVNEEYLISKIYYIRNQKVMLDEDLAELYGVETKRLNEQVKRNIIRFPGDFMFQLTENEFINLKSQFATSRWGGRRKLPYAFSEHGVLMLSGVLKALDFTIFKKNFQFKTKFPQICILIKIKNKLWHIQKC
jgi:hypothetical protein